MKQARCPFHSQMPGCPLHSQMPVPENSSNHSIIKQHRKRGVLEKYTGEGAGSREQRRGKREEVKTNVYLMSPRNAILR